MDSNSSPLVVHQEGTTLWLTLNRPEAHNSLTPSIVAAIAGALDRIETGAAIRALVITGAGAAFCAGADLKAVLSNGTGTDDPAAALRRFLSGASEVFNRLERLRVPTVAAINGIALAGGLELALCCDFIIADEAAKLGEGHAKFAQLPGGGGSVRLPRRIGTARTKYMMFTGEFCTAATALEWGLVDEVAPAGTLHAKVDAMLAKFADKSPVGLSRMKQLVQEGLEQPLEVALRAELLMSEVHAHCADRNEGLEAFAAKRRPAYVGR